MKVTPFLERGITLFAQRCKGSTTGKTKRSAGRTKGNTGRLKERKDPAMDLLPVNNVFCLCTMLARLLGEERSLDRHRSFRDRFFKKILLNDVGEGKPYATIAAVPFYQLIDQYHAWTLGLPMEHLNRWMTSLNLRGEDLGETITSTSTMNTPDAYLPPNLLGMRRIHLSSIGHLDGQLKLLDRKIHLRSSYEAAIASLRLASEDDVPSPVILSASSSPSSLSELPSSPQLTAPLRFVCLDIEAYERAPRKLTEFGLVIYDRSTGYTEHHHLIIREHGRFRNSHFAPDAKNRFVFGESMKVSTGEAMAFLESHLREPRTALVGHALPSDLGFLARAKIKRGKRVPAALLEAIPKYDLQYLHRCRAASDRHRRLEDICQDLAITGWDAVPRHNAGNDAALTMAAFLRLMRIIE